MDDRTRKLEEALRAERELRQVAEARNAVLIEKAALWRRRAEERAERIQRLLDESRTARLLRAIRRSGATRTEPAPGAVVAAAGPTAAGTGRLGLHLTAVPVATVVDDRSLATALDVLRRTEVAQDPAALAAADLVVVEPEAYARLGDEPRRALREWMELDARQPLVVWAGSPPSLAAVGDLTTVADVVAVASGEPPSGSILVPPAFDVATFRPPVPYGPPDGAPSIGLPSGGHAITVTRRHLAEPAGWLIEAAAAGTPLAVDGVVPDREKGAVAARRWAYRHHAPWVRAGQLLDMAGVGGPRALPRVAGILLSRRPEDVVGQLAALANQSYPRFEVVVGLHGIGRPEGLAEAVASSPFPVTVLELPASITLGEALNRSIEGTGAALVAKTDDDDHYGPAHIEDAVHALAYSDADIVGKGAMFTYVEAEDRTVIRRAGQEERQYEGFLTGGTIVFERSIWERVGFPHRSIGEDNGFLAGARALGAGVYVNSRFEFCYLRRMTGHTWVAGDDVFLAGSVPAWEGRHLERVQVPDLDTGESQR